MKVSPAFSKAAGSRDRVPGRAPQSAEPPIAHKRSGSGFKGETLSRGFPLLFLLFVRVRRYVGRWSLACPAIRPHFFGACPKKRCRAAKEKRFLPRRLHHSRERCRSVDGTFLARLGEGVGGCLSPYLRRGRTGLVMAALRGRSSSRASLSLSGSALLQKRVSLGLHPVSLRKSKEMGWNGQDQRGLLHGERRTRKNRRPYRAAVFLFIPGACRRLSTRERWSISTARPG